MSDVWAALTKLDATVETTADSAVTVTAEVTTYFTEQIVTLKVNRLLWWKVNQHRFPVLAKLAQISDLFGCPTKQCSE